jgi:hypothetical protein
MFFVDGEMVQTKVVEKIRTHNYVYIFFGKLCRLCGNLEK